MRIMDPNSLRIRV